MERKRITGPYNITIYTVIYTSKLFIVVKEFLMIKKIILRKLCPIKQSVIFTFEMCFRKRLELLKRLWNVFQKASAPPTEKHLHIPSS